MKTLLDQILADYEAKQSNEYQEILRESTPEENELLTDYVLNDNLQAIYDYYDLKERLDKEWMDNEMPINLNPQITQEQLNTISRYVIQDILNQEYDFETLKKMLSEEWIKRVNIVWDDQMHFVYD